MNNLKFVVKTHRTEIFTNVMCI